VQGTNLACMAIRVRTSIRRRPVRVLALVGLLLLLLAPPGDAGGRKLPKHTSSRYVSAGYNYVSGSSDGGPEYNVASPMEFVVERNERWASITIDDRTGLPVAAVASQDVDGDGSPDKTWDVCGATVEPFEIAPGKPLVVAPAPVPCSGGAASTTGAVFVEFISPGAAPKGPVVQRVEPEQQVTYAGLIYQGADGGVASGSYGMDRWVTDRYVSVAVTDATGQAAFFTIYPQNAPPIAVCGGTEEPIEIPAGGDELYVEMGTGICPDGTPATSTHGVIDITLSNLP